MIFAIPMTGEYASAEEGSTYVSADATYTYSTAGASAESYESTLISLNSHSDVVFIQSSLEGYPLKKINANAFAEFTGTAVVVPTTVTAVDKNAFDSSSIKTIYFLCDAPEGFIVSDEMEIYCLEGTKGWNGENVLPLYAYDAGDFRLNAYVINGEAIIHTLVSGYEIRIPKSIYVGGIDYPVKRIDSESFRNSDVVTLSMPDSIEIVGSRAFYNCEKLSIVDFSKNIKIICDEAFRECVSLSSIELQNVWFIGFESFRMCYSVKSIDIPDSVKVLGCGAFYVCSGCTELTIGSGLNKIEERAFGYLADLDAVLIRGKISSVGDYAFYDCSSLSSFSFEGTEYIGNYAFFGCKQLTEIELNNVVSIGNNAFSQCRNLTDIDFGNGLKSIGDYAFYLCRTLEEIIVPKNVETIGDCAFLGCSSLADVYIEGDMPKVGEDVFKDVSENFVIHHDDPNNTPTILLLILFIAAVALIIVCYVKIRSKQFP